MAGQADLSTSIQATVFFPLGVQFTVSFGTTQVEKNKYTVMNEKPQKCTCMPNVLAFISQPNLLSSAGLQGDSAAAKMQPSQGLYPVGQGRPLVQSKRF